MYGTMKVQYHEGTMEALYRTLEMHIAHASPLLPPCFTSQCIVDTISYAIPLLTWQCYYCVQSQSAVSAAWTPAPPAGALLLLGPQEFFDGEIRKLGVEKSYFPMFVSERVLTAGEGPHRGFRARGQLPHCGAGVVQCAPPTAPLLGLTHGFPA